MWPRAELLHTSEWREVVWVQLSKAHPWHSWQELYVGCCGWHSQEAQKCGTLSGHHHQIQAWVPPWHWDYSHSDTPFMERKITSHLLWRSQKDIFVYLIVWKKKFIRQSRGETFILVWELKNQMSEIYYFLSLAFFFGWVPHAVHIQCNSKAGVRLNPSWATDYKNSWRLSHFHERANIPTSLYSWNSVCKSRSGPPKSLFKFLYLFNYYDSMNTPTPPKKKKKNQQRKEMKRKVHTTL